MSGGGGGVRSVPVLVYPTLVDFYMDDPSTHKQILTLYNPSVASSIHYKVMCTNPSFYVVIEPTGTIYPQKCIDIIIRHVAISSPTALEKEDKFRITISDDPNSWDNPLGKKDIVATLHPGCPETKGSASFPHGQQHQQRQQQELISSTSNSSDKEAQLPRVVHQQPNYVACLAAVICIAALFLPTEGEKSALSLKDYPWLILTLNQKLVFAYVLGLVTMAILRVA